MYTCFAPPSLLSRPLLSTPRPCCCIPEILIVVQYLFEEDASEHKDVAPTTPPFSPGRAQDVISQSVRNCRLLNAFAVTPNVNKHVDQSPEDAEKQCLPRFENPSRIR
eukprot:1195207-Prorocentrum_minimum.AAC.4